MVGVQCGFRRLVMDIIHHECTIHTHTGADGAICHDLFLYGVDIFQVFTGNKPFHVPGIIDMKIRIEPFRWSFIGLTVYIPDCAFSPGKVCACHHVITTHVYFQAGTAGRIDILIIKFIKPVPPVQVVFRQIRFSALTLCSPNARHKQVAFHWRHGTVGPAGAALLVLY